MNDLRSLKNQTIHANTELRIDSLMLRCFNNKNKVKCWMKWGKCEIWSSQSGADEDACFLG